MLSTLTAGNGVKVPPVEWAGRVRGKTTGAWAGWVGWWRADWAITISWLVCDGLRVAPLQVATLSWERSRGLLGRDGIDGAILLQPAFVVHTVGMRFPIDVAFCDRELRVVGVVNMGRNRLTRPRIRVRAIVEAEARSFAGWGLKRGSRLGVEYDGD